MKLLKTSLSSTATFRLVATCWALLVLIVAASSASPAFAQNCHMEHYATGDGGTFDNLVCDPGHSRRTAPAPAPDLWGAIAATPDGVHWGTSWRHPSQSVAGNEALKACIKDVGVNGGCRVLTTVADVCVSLVNSVPDRRSFIGGPTGASNFAANNGLLKCSRAGGRACRVQTSVCGDGQKHILQGSTTFSNGNPIFEPKSNGAFGRR